MTGTACGMTNLQQNKKKPSTEHEDILLNTLCLFSSWFWQSKSCQQWTYKDIVYSVSNMVFKHQKDDQQVILNKIKIFHDMFSILQSFNFEICANQYLTIVLQKNLKKDNTIIV